MEHRYTIHDAAALLGVSTDAIRLYEKEGLVTPVRDEKNGYRYYAPTQLHRIMAVALYRKVDIGLQEIHQLLQAKSFSEISAHFSLSIETMENKIQNLQMMLDKLRFMKAHIDSLNADTGHFCQKPLPVCYNVFTSKSPCLVYDELKDVISSPVFSYGNFCYTMQCESGTQYAFQQLNFLIREEMMALCPWNFRTSEFSKTSTCDCIYTVSSCLETESISLNFHEMEEYAHSLGFELATYGYAFYVYSLIDEPIRDFYEIYIPIIR